jgi:dynein heavy chain
MELEEANQETLILMKAIRDMNMPKFVAEDVPLFNALFSDLFTNMDLPEMSNDTLREEIENQMKLNKLQPKPEHVQKIIQLYDSKLTRHGNMLVGESLSGKSTCWKILQKVLNVLNEREPNKY